MKYKHIHRFLLTLHHLKPSTYNLWLSHIKGFLRYCEQHNHVKVILPLLMKKREDTLLPKNISLTMMLALCQPRKNEKTHLQTYLRNQAIIEFLFSTGVRSIELRQLRVGSLSDDLSRCVIATAKSGVTRTVYLGNPAREALLTYLNSWNIDKRKDKHQYLFTSKDKAMTGTMLYNSVKNLAKKRIGIAVTPHMIRHTFATEMLRATGCLRSVQELMGHVNISNTARYCYLNYHDVLQAINKYHPHGKENLRSQLDDKND